MNLILGYKQMKDLTISIRVLVKEGGGEICKLNLLRCQAKSKAYQTQNVFSNLLRNSDKTEYTLRHCYLKLIPTVSV